MYVVQGLRGHSKLKMVCVPCFIIPILLFLWHKFLQPYVLRFWNPWAVKDSEGNVKTEFPINCEGGVCAFRRKPADKTDSENDETKTIAKCTTEPKELKAE